MLRRERQALEHLLNYCWEDEARDFEEQEDDGQEHHVWNEMQILREYLDRVDSGDAASAPE